MGQLDHQKGTRVPWVTNEERLVTWVTIDFDRFACFPRENFLTSLCRTCPGPRETQKIGIASRKDTIDIDILAPASGTDAFDSDT